MSASSKNLRKHLSADALFLNIKTAFESIERNGYSNGQIPLADILMSAFAMFSVKDESLLAFDRRRQLDSNLSQIYHINQIPSDTQMRARLDVVDPRELLPSFTDIFRQAQRGKILDEFKSINNSCLLLLDGTGYFSSNTIHCENCLEKVNKKTGEVTYSHQMLGAAIAHPDKKEVIPLAPEPIIKQDGQEKNDCERNAAKRFFEQLKKDHPRMNFTIVEDALSSNAPHIHEIKKNNWHYILGVKPKGNQFLFNHVDASSETIEFEIKKGNTIHRFRYLNGAPLNAANQDVLVNFLEYWEITPKKTKRFSWITDHKIFKNNAFDIMRAGRARWKIENETFNTLKNQGYNFEHNYGHGKQHLSVVFANLMMLAFLVDQIQQIACSLFQAVLKKIKVKKQLWENMRSFFHVLEFDSMAHIYHAMLYGVKVTGIEISHEFD